MGNIITILIIVAIIGSAAAYVIRAKKNGVKCIGCNCGSSGSGSGCSCGGNCTCESDDGCSCGDH